MTISIHKTSTEDSFSGVYSECVHEVLDEVRKNGSLTEGYAPRWTPRGGLRQVGSSYTVDVFDVVTEKQIAVFTIDIV